MEHVPFLPGGKKMKKSSDISTFDAGWKMEKEGGGGEEKAHLFLVLWRKERKGKGGGKVMSRYSFAKVGGRPKKGGKNVGGASMYSLTYIDRKKGERGGKKKRNTVGFWCFLLCYPYREGG